MENEMSWIMQIKRRADGSPCSFAREYVKDMNFEAFDGRGLIDTTPRPEEAKRFDSYGEAYAFYRTVSECRPERSDGLPNRPLRSFTVALINEGLGGG